MKNVVKKSKVLVSVMILAMVVAMLAACGSSKSNALVGTWKLTSVESAGVTMTSEALESQGISMSFDFKEDGSVTLEAVGETSEGTYTQDGTKVSVTIEGGTQDLKFENDQLSFEIEDTGTYYFEIQK